MMDHGPGPANSSRFTAAKACSIRGSRTPARAVTRRAKNALSFADRSSIADPRCHRWGAGFRHRPSLRDAIIRPRSSSEVSRMDRRTVLAVLAGGIAVGGALPAEAQTRTPRQVAEGFAASLSAHDIE